MGYYQCDSFTFSYQFWIWHFAFLAHCVLMKHQGEMEGDCFDLEIGLFLTKQLQMVTLLQPSKNRDRAGVLIRMNTIIKMAFVIFVL